MTGAGRYLPARAETCGEELETTLTWASAPASAATVPDLPVRMHDLPLVGDQGAAG
ncbi:hypothetical protein ACFVYE_28265 [Streptomyces sp. NPDC058239]|uniref:hypothetical protein n=1 Tax=unclassified Streptomyces TaxID=2593676 RepID=UPI00365281C9